MKVKESSGFFCVVYFSDTKKTCYYHKVWQPSKLANTLKNWLWIKVFIDKQTYLSNRQTADYLAIFDKDMPISNFTFAPYTKTARK